MHRNFGLTPEKLSIGTTRQKDAKFGKEKSLKDSL